MAGARRGQLLGREGELLLDLVYVFALTRFSQRLIEDFTLDRRILLPEFGQTALLLLALWLVWVRTSWVTSRHSPERPAIQLITIWVTFGSMIMAVTLPHAFGARGLTFAITYVAIQFGRSLLLLGFAAGREQHSPVRALCWTAASAVPWIAGGAFFPQSPARGWLWALALAIDYAGLVLGWPVPKFGRSRIAEWRIAGEHLAERYQQFIIITIGETILLTGLTFANRFEPDQVLPTAVSFATAVLIWRIYFHRAGALLPDAIEVASRPARRGQSEIYTHLVMVTGILATGVGNALVIDHPTGHQDSRWLAVILGGPAMFLAGRIRLEYDVFGRMSASRVTGILALAAAAPAMTHLPSRIAAITAALILAGIAIWDATRDRKHPHEEPSPPG